MQSFTKRFKYRFKLLDRDCLRTNHTHDYGLLRISIHRLPLIHTEYLAFGLLPLKNIHMEIANSSIILTDFIFLLLTRYENTTEPHL